MTAATAPRYIGSLTEFHGEVMDVADCRCPDCCTLDPWDAARRAALLVRTGAGETVMLDHIRFTSFTGRPA